MSLIELLPAIRDLSKDDRLRLIQTLADDLAREDGVVIESGTSFPIWSPLHAHEAAETLLKALAEQEPGA